MNLNQIKALIQEALKEEPTGDDWLDSRYAEQVHWIGHTNPYYKLFYLLAKEFKPNLCVELGSWQATGASHFAAGNLGGQVITIDIHRDDKNAQSRTIEAANHYPNLTYLNRWTWDAVELVKALNTPIDILFIDAWHDYLYAKREWDLYLPLLASPALVICDDITEAYNFEGMYRFWEEMPEPKYLSKEGLHKEIPMGFVIVNQKDKLVTKPLTEDSNVATDRISNPVKPTTTTKRGRPRKES